LGSRVTDEVVWHEGYPPPVGRPGLTKRWSSRTVEKRALCPFHEQWEAVWRWRWTDLPPEYRGGWPWLQQMEAHTEQGCQVVYLIGPDGIHLRPDLSTGSGRTTMDLPEPPRPGLRPLPPPRPDLRAPPPPPPSRSRKDHSARKRTIAIWKQWWVWAIVVVLILIAAGAGIAETMQTGAEEGLPSPAAPPTAASPAPETAQVPNVEGESIEDATSELEAAGFVASVATKLTNAADPGDVLLQSVTAGSFLEVGGTIGLIVAKAPPTIPNVVGETLANARRALKNAGFEVGNVTQQTSSKKKGTVISQSPDAGTSARPGRAVSLVTAKLTP
jgi:PASTA domain